MTTGQRFSQHTHMVGLTESMPVLPAGSACIAFREEAHGNAQCLPGVEPAEAD